MLNKYKIQYNDKKKPGDQIDIIYMLDDITIKDKTTITHIDDNLLYTCGHCFADNARTIYGDLIKTSGFDTDDESLEEAIIKIHPKYSDLFISDHSLLNDIVSVNKDVYMIHNRNRSNGKILYLIESEDDINKLNIKYPITKLQFPYYLIKSNTITKGGYSGSPWFYNDKLFGQHIGKIQLDDTHLLVVKPFIKN